ncbi:hypothetical protein [Hwanghaeella sp.]|uniref:hypothetical protein n=1 Tax=Hwanghaeella sp. TaxID=2605943 RepID=UPI003CCC3686
MRHRVALSGFLSRWCGEKFERRFYGILGCAAARIGDADEKVAVAIFFAALDWFVVRKPNLEFLFSAADRDVFGKRLPGFV